MSQKVKYQSEGHLFGEWETVPPTDWGKDHWSTLVFLETAAVDNKGLVQNAHMRTHPRLHPKYAHIGSTGEYPTRLRDGELEDHDDWSCMEDMIDAGMMTAQMRAKSVWVSFTRYGIDVAGAARAFKAQGGNYADFSAHYYVPCMSAE